MVSQNPHIVLLSAPERFNADSACAHSAGARADMCKHLLIAVGPLQDGLLQSQHRQTQSAGLVSHAAQHALTAHRIPQNTSVGTL